MGYNVRVIRYPQGNQVTIYDTVIGDKKQCRDKALPTPFFDENGYIQIASHGGNSFPFSIVLDDDGLNCVLPSASNEELKTNQERSKYVSLARTKNTVFYLCRSNKWDWFLTFTFNPDKVDSFNYEEVTAKLSQWLKNARKTCPDMKYIVVPELHSTGRFHFHGLFADCDGLGFVDSGHKSHGQKVYNVGTYHFGWTTATKVVSNVRVTKYVCKYITKELVGMSKGKKRYWATRNLERADTEFFNLHGQDLDEFISILDKSVQHISVKEYDDHKIIYYELQEENI